MAKKPHRSPINHRIILVKRPRGWRPCSTTDVPPNVEIHCEDTLAEAQGFRDGFNKAEMKNPSGWWAIDCVSL